MEERVLQLEQRVNELATLVNHVYATQQTLSSVSKRCLLGVVCYPTLGRCNQAQDAPVLVPDQNLVVLGLDRTPVLRQGFYEC